MLNEVLSLVGQTEGKHLLLTYESLRFTQGDANLGQALFNTT
jgi:hypothetical protein